MTHHAITDSLSHYPLPPEFNAQDREAVSLIIAGLFDVWRFLGDPTIDHAVVQNSTGQHSLDTVESIHQFLQHIQASYGIDTTTLHQQVSSQVLMHDAGEIIEEPATFWQMLTSFGEEVDTFNYERGIAAYFMGLAYQSLEHHADFYGNLAEIRALFNDRKQENFASIANYFSISIEDAQALSLEDIWHSFQAKNPLLAQYTEAQHPGVERWMAAYDNIEQTVTGASKYTNLSAALGKLFEKSDGNAFYHAHQGVDDVDATHAQKTSSDIWGGIKRVEAILGDVFYHARHNAEMSGLTQGEALKIAQDAAKIIFNRNIMAFANAKPILNTKETEQEPGIDNPLADHALHWRDYATTPREGIRHTRDLVLYYHAAMRLIERNEWHPAPGDVIASMDPMPQVILQEAASIMKQIDHHLESSGSLSNLPDEFQTLIQNMRLVERPIPALGLPGMMDLKQPHLAGIAAKREDLSPA